MKRLFVSFLRTRLLHRHSLIGRVCAEFGRQLVPAAGLATLLITKYDWRKRVREQRVTHVSRIARPHRPLKRSP